MPRAASVPPGAFFSPPHPATPPHQQPLPVRAQSYSTGTYPPNDVLLHAAASAAPATAQAPAPAAIM